MRQFLLSISGKVRPILALALVLLVVVLYLALSSIDHTGMYAALQDAIMLDVPEARMQALFTAMDKLSQTQVHEKIILAVIIAFSGCISLLSQPATPEQEPLANIIRAVLSVEDEEKVEMQRKLNDMSDRLAELQRDLGD